MKFFFYRKYTMVLANKYSFKEFKRNYIQKYEVKNPLSFNKAFIILIKTLPINNKYLYICYSLFIFSITIFLPNISSCGAFDTINSPGETFENMIQGFSPQELENFNIALDEQLAPSNNTQIDPFVSRLFLFVIINIGIIVVTHYGMTIFNTITENISNLIHDSREALLEAARQAAIRRVNRILENPDNLVHVQNAAARVLQMRQGTFSPSA